jgi:hypothetical protein
MPQKYCPHYAVPLNARADDTSNEALVYRARCKQWECAYCAEINRKVWRARIMLEVQRYDSLWYFWTLTLAGEDHKSDTAYSLQIWRESWDKLMKRVKRECGSMRYIRVFEAHTDGTLHVHMLADKTYADVREIIEDDGRKNFRSEALKKALTGVGLGWRHDLRPIITTDVENDGEARNVSSYVVKYLTKGIQSYIRAKLRDAGLSRVRMIQTSRGWAQVPANEKDRAWRTGAIKFDEFDRLIEQGGVLIDTNIGRSVKASDFHGYDYYPNKDSDLADLADGQQ